MTHVFDCCSGQRANVSETLSYLLEVDISAKIAADPEDVISGITYEFALIIEEIDVVARIIRKNWCQIQGVVANDFIIPHEELIQSRDQVNKCLRTIVNGLKCCESEKHKQKFLKQLKTLSGLIQPISETNIFVKLISPSVSKEKCPIYHYFHTYQEMQFYVLLLYNISGNGEEIRNRVSSIIVSLVRFSESGYNLNNKCAFVCECNRHFWILIQAFCESVLGDDSFWPIFNKSIENKNNEYVLWMLQQVAQLQTLDINGTNSGNHSERVKPNFPLLEPVIKQIFTNIESSTVLSVLKSLQPLVCDAWLKFGKVEIYQVLWDYFSKRLNVSTRNPNFAITTVELVDLIDTVLWGPQDSLHDFELFVSMLTTHLTEHPYHWGKMKGRIYSQLGPNKLKELNATGTFHVLLLFVSLTKINFDELSKKFLGFIDGLPVEKKQKPLIWSFYAAFVVRHVRENRTIETSISVFVKMAEGASTDHNLSHLLKSFVADFDYIVKCSSNLQLHQWLLINTWIHQYMTTCYYPDLLSLLSILFGTLERVNQEQVWCEWEPAFKQYVYPTLKPVSSSRTAPEISGVLAGKIVLLSPSLFSEAFTFFNADSVSAKVTASFLCVVLDNNHQTALSPQQEAVVLQSWSRFCLMTRDGYDDLTRNVLKLELIPEFIRTALAQAKDPLCAFIELIGAEIRQHLQSSVVTKLCDILFGHAERWIVQYLSQPESEGIVLRIYTIVGLAFYKIGPLLYNKHKANCPYARLVSALLLPTELVVGKPLNPHVLQGVKKTWHLFFEATVRLNVAQDAFLDRILREMIVRYVPLFATADSPLLKSLDNEGTAATVLEKMAAAFFAQSSKEAESSTFKALRIVNDFIQATTSTNLLKLVVNKTLHGLFEVVMFHNSQRNLAISTIKNITMSPLYLHVKREFEDVIVAVAEKHLAFNTSNYFQLLGHLAKLIPLDLKNVVPRIKQQVANVERMRGVGYDKNLRLNLERLEANLLQLS